MSIDSTWLRCPNCSRPLGTVADRVLGCPDGHRFDLSKHGTVTLLPPRAPHTIGDSREMLDARAQFLDSGIFEPIAAAVSDAYAAAVPVGSGAVRIADLGCGTGYYSGRLAADFPDAAFLLADRSPIAVRVASRAVPGATGVVLDLWRPLPIRDAVVDVSINVFAPRNPDEFARITRPGGSLIVVVPTERHLRELRAQGGMLDVPSGKSEQVTDQLARSGFRADARRGVQYSIPLSAAQARLLVAMGPSAHHVPDEAGIALGGPSTGDPDSSAPPGGQIDVTVAVDVLRFHLG